MGGRVGDDKYLAAQVPDLLGPQARAPLKLGVGSDAMAAVKKWAVDLKVEVKRLRAEVEHLKAALEDTKQHCQALEREAEKSQGEAKNLRSTRRQLDDEVLKLARDVEALRTEVQLIGAKVFAQYKVSRGFKLYMERIGCVTYEFKYWVTLECF
ncbi:hypothetical protein BHE74_00015639 [Ensete ventricosum]|nr:hypothetical protein GW17_00044855 [Ensete ventricosum]RWW76283.1 hypothetical protein BHE74_00015639 [Ensete ventricosum]